MSKELEFTKEIKDLWLKALKSGDYKKGTAELKNVFFGITKHCCLGVLCEIHPDMGFDRNGSNPVVEGIKYKGGYHPFFILLGEDTVKELYRNNDDNPDDNYKGVIKIIKKLKPIS